MLLKELALEGSYLALLGAVEEFGIWMSELDVRAWLRGVARSRMRVVLIGAGQLVEVEYLYPKFEPCVLDVGQSSHERL